MKGAEKFPTAVIDKIEDYADAYLKEYSRAASLVDRSQLARVASLVQQTVSSGGTIYSCGNGGSAAISNHLLCDFAKGMQTDTALRPRVISLSSHAELLSAIGNDIGYEETFSYQVRTWGRPGDLLMAISSSGNSENIVRALREAKSAGMGTVALTGFDGGRAAGLADASIHVPSQNYGVVEDFHQSVMHMLAQFVRAKHMDPALIPQRKF
jgi:phosphoheptose isomerase